MMSTAKGVSVRITSQTYAQSQAEAEFQTKITDLCDLLGLKWHHEGDSRRSKKGWPDLVIAGTEVVFAELKTETGKVSPDQAEWLGKLKSAGGTVYLWRPSDWNEIERVLFRLAGRRRVV